VLGAEYTQELPAFVDRGRKGLTLSASGLPDGLVLEDDGAGKGVVRGKPTAAGQASIRITATDHNNRTAQMTASLAVADGAPQTSPSAEGQAGSPSLATPRPGQTVAVLRAVVGVEFASSLPPFHDGAETAELKLRVEPEPPAGVVFADLGAGAGRLLGTPTAPGAYAFDIVATDLSGRSGRMGVRLTVDPAHVEPPSAPAVAAAPPAAPAPSREQASLAATAPVAVPDPDDRARAFVAQFDGGDCFFIARVGSVDGQETYLGLGHAVEPFQRFDAAYKAAVGAEANIRLGQMTAEQCPALGLLRAAGAGGPEPILAIRESDIGRGGRLAGTVSNLAGRRLYLLHVDGGGGVRRLPAAIGPGGETATFDVSVAPETASRGAYQLLIALVSPTPLPMLEGARAESSRLAAGGLVEEARRASAAAAADYFKFVD
jgi:hypothetical protein